jgi:hypothetical protein
MMAENSVRREAPGSTPIMVSSRKSRNYESTGTRVAGVTVVMKLKDVRVERACDRIRIIADIENEPVKPYLAFPREMEGFIAGTADAFVPMILVPCLEKGEALEVVPPVSPQMVWHVPRIMDVLLALFPNFHRVPVKLNERQEAAAPEGTAVASLFSGGVDSFYTLLKGFTPGADPDLRATHVFFMRGLEQPLDQSSGADATLNVVRDIAGQNGVGVLWGETNIRLLFGLNYELYYHASALIGSALALSRGVKRLLVPSTFSYGQLIPWGSHPLLDELWSVESMEVIHHGAEARRVDKIEMLARDHRSTLRHLRVCLKNQAGPGNCGRCQKCARTMMALEVVGARADASTFPLVSRQTLAHWLRADNPIFVEELRDLARQTGSREALNFLNRVVRKQKRRHAVKALIDSTPVLADMMPAVNRLRRRFRAAA